MIRAQIIADSCHRTNRLTTLVLTYPRFIHGELLTHRDFSRSSASSRAIPIVKLIEQVRNDPALPIHWGLNRPGMQAVEQHAQPEIALEAWRKAAMSAADQAEILHSLGLHKQVANRVLEPFMWMRTIVSSTHWANFFALRDHPDAQPELRALAIEIREAMRLSTPTELVRGQWHMPYVSEDEGLSLEVSRKVSAARCGRVSYLRDTDRNVENDLRLYHQLTHSVPMHASPLEHVATPCVGRAANFSGWLQLRHSQESI